MIPRTRSVAPRWASSFLVSFALACSPTPGAVLEDAGADVRVDACAPGSLERVGLPCLGDADCPAGLVCLAGGTLTGGSSCQRLDVEGCPCPPGSTAGPFVSASGTRVVCAVAMCPPREVDLGGLGRGCSSLHDCAAWMVCDPGMTGAACALPCDPSCPCPDGTRCVDRVVPAGVVTRCE